MMPDQPFTCHVESWRCAPSTTFPVVRWRPPRLEPYAVKPGFCGLSPLELTCNCCSRDPRSSDELPILRKTD